MQRFRIKMRDDPALLRIDIQLPICTEIESEREFNELCQGLLADFQVSTAGRNHYQFHQVLPRARAQCPTPWGGVYNTKQDGHHVEKYLAVAAGGYLPLEMHRHKDERIRVVEGEGLLLYRCGADRSRLDLVRLTTGDKFHFPVGFEHCLLGGADLLVYETSHDPVGQDDIIIVFGSNCDCYS